MCKILLITNTQKIKGTKKLINAAIDLLKTERDGFGYHIQGLAGDYIERTNKIDGFKCSIDRDNKIKPFEVESYSRQGSFSKSKGVAMFHGRISTNDKSIVNVHPIQKNGWSIVHNGVVTNHGEKYLKNTQNDSEDIAHYLSTTGIKGIESNLSGYYAVGALDPDGKLHVIKDSTASLYSCEVSEWSAQVFATTARIIEDLCAAFGVTPGVIREVQDNTYLIYDKGELVSHSTISPRGYSSYESRFSGLSLGRDLEQVSPLTVNVESGQSWNDSPLDYDIDSYLEDIDKNWKEYQFYDRKDSPINYHDFQKMSIEDKLLCSVFDYSGFPLEPEYLYQFQFERDTGKKNKKNKSKGA